MEIKDTLYYMLIQFGSALTIVDSDVKLLRTIALLIFYVNMVYFYKKVQ